MYLLLSILISFFVKPVQAMNQKNAKAMPAVQAAVKPADVPASGLVAKQVEKKSAVAAKQEQLDAIAEDFEPVLAEVQASAPTTGVSREQANVEEKINHDAVTQVIAENAQKLRNPMSATRWFATKCSDGIWGIGTTVLAELRAKKLQDSGKPGSAARRIERAAEDLARNNDYNGMRELLQKAKELGLPITPNANKIAKELFIKQRHAVTAHTYQQLLVGMRDMGLVHDGEKIAGMKSKKLTPLEVMRGLCDEVVALFEADQKRALDEAALKTE
jgi:hypothetical protein